MSMGADFCNNTKADWNFYYWDETHVNDKGESLCECIESYGVGGWYCKENGFAAALIFESADKDAGNSWMLGFKHDNKQKKAKRYEEDISVHNMSPTTPLGVKITNLLKESVFEMV